MYCPDCGKQNPAGQKFCRACGLSLKPISQALAGEAVPADTRAESQANSSIILQGDHQGDQRFWQNPLIYALLLVLLGIVIAFFGDNVLHTKTISDIGAVVALLGIGLLGFKGVMLVLMAQGYSARPKQTAEFEATYEHPYERTPGLLPSEPPSVTETTTRQLDASVERGTEKRHDTQPTL